MRVLGTALALVLAVTLAGGCRRQAVTTAPALEFRQLERAHLYRGDETSPALVFQFPRDLGDVAGVVGLYERARLGAAPDPAACRVRLVFFRHALAAVVLRAMDDGQVLLDHPELGPARRLESVALWEALLALAGPGGEPGPDPGPPVAGSPRVLRHELQPDPPAALALITLHFDRPMDGEDLRTRLAFSPLLPGVLSHQGDTLLFFVSGYPPAGQYTLTVDSGARAADGQVLGEDYRLVFHLPALEPATSGLRDAVNRTLAGSTLAFERVAGAGAGERWLPPGVPPPAGAGATVFTGRYVARDQVHYSRGDETTTLEGYREGDRLWLRDEVAGEAGGWIGRTLADEPPSVEWADFLGDLLDRGRWGGLASLDRSGVAVWLEAGLLGVRLPSLDARLGIMDEWEGGPFVSYSLLVRLAPGAGGQVVAEIAYRLVYHRPGDVYAFSYFDDVSRFRVGEPLVISYPADLGR
ncbi:MAG: hypothetical protein RDU89_05970 [bacterium]|nr:hypothetical protein [bacterium]